MKMTMCNTSTTTGTNKEFTQLKCVMKGNQMDNVRENVNLLFGFQGKGLKQFKKDTYKPAF